MTWKNNEWINCHLEFRTTSKRTGTEKKIFRSDHEYLKRSDLALIQFHFDGFFLFSISNISICRSNRASSTCRHARMFYLTDNMFLQSFLSTTTIIVTRMFHFTCLTFIEFPSIHPKLELLESTQCRDGLIRLHYSPYENWNVHFSN